MQRSSPAKTRILRGQQRGRGGRRRPECTSSHVGRSDCLQHAPGHVRAGHGMLTLAMFVEQQQAAALDLALALARPSAVYELLGCQCIPAT
jgi:hypothetical protein